MNIPLATPENLMIYKPIYKPIYNEIYDINQYKAIYDDMYSFSLFQHYGEQNIFGKNIYFFSI